MVFLVETHTTGYLKHRRNLRGERIGNVGALGDRNCRGEHDETPTLSETESHVCPGKSFRRAPTGVKILDTTLEGVACAEGGNERAHDALL